MERRVMTEMYARFRMRAVMGIARGKVFSIVMTAIGVLMNLVILLAGANIQMFHATTATFVRMISVTPIPAVLL